MGTVEAEIDEKDLSASTDKDVVALGDGRQFLGDSSRLVDSLEDKVDLCFGMSEVQIFEVDCSPKTNELEVAVERDALEREGRDDTDVDLEPRRNGFEGTNWKRDRTKMGREGRDVEGK